MKKILDDVIALLLNFSGYSFAVDYCNDPTIPNIELE